MPSSKHLIARKQLWSILHDGKGRIGQAFQFLLVLLILASVGMLPLEYIEARYTHTSVLYFAEVFITSLFTLEYALRVYAAPNRLRYVFSFFGIIDLLSIVPFYLALLDTKFLRTLRLFRLIRLIRLASISAGGRASTEDGDEQGMLHPQEKIEYVISHHPFYLILGCVPTLIVVAVAVTILSLFPLNPVSLAASFTLFLFGLIFVWRAWLNYSHDLIYITSDRLLFIDQHLLGRSIHQLTYFSITNVRPTYTGFLSYIMRYGSITVETAADQLGHFEFHIVRGHEKAAHIIMRKCTEMQNRHVAR